MLKSLCSTYDSAKDIILSKGNAMMKPAKTGFFRESQLAKEIIKAEKKILAKKIIIYLRLLVYPKKFLIFEIGLLNGS